MGGVVILANPVVPTALVDRHGNPLYPTLFGETRVAFPCTLADNVNKYEVDPRLYGTLTVTGGTVTHVPAKSAIHIAVTGTNASRSLLRTHTFYRYQAGKAMHIRTSVIHDDAGQVNQTRRWGFFDDGDGVYFTLVGTTVNIAVRTSTSGSPVDTLIAQAAWNVDKMDGTGPSGVTLDVTKGNIYELAFQWLGVGSVQYIINGHLVHETDNTNTFNVPYMKTAQLPLSWEVINTGASVIGGFIYVCSTVAADAGTSPERTTFGAFNAADIVVTTTERPVLSIRPKLTYNSIPNRMVIIPNLLIASTESGRAGYRLVANSILTGAAFNSVDATSGMEFDVAATSGTGGQTLMRGFLPNTIDVSVPIDLHAFFDESGLGRIMRLDAFGTIPDILTVYMINDTTGTINGRASLAWDEIR